MLVFIGYALSIFLYILNTPGSIFDASSKDAIAIALFAQFLLFAFYFEWQTIFCFAFKRKWLKLIPVYSLVADLIFICMKVNDPTDPWMAPFGFSAAVAVLLAWAVYACVYIKRKKRSALSNQFDHADTKTLNESEGRL